MVCEIKTNGRKERIEVFHALTRVGGEMPPMLHQAVLRAIGMMGGDGRAELTAFADAKRPVPCEVERIGEGKYRVRWGWEMNGEEILDLSMPKFDYADIDC